MSKLEKFVASAKLIHGQYLYHNVKFINNRTKVSITCPIHGDFPCSPDNHIRRKSGCPSCKAQKTSKRLRKSQYVFLDQAISIHGDRYFYSLVDYSGNTNHIRIGCPTHGEFLQTPKRHLRGQGCPKCAGYNMSIDEFVDKAHRIHKSRYNV